MVTGLIPPRRQEREHHTHWPEGSSRSMLPILLDLDFFTGLATVCDYGLDSCPGEAAR